MHLKKSTMNECPMQVAVSYEREISRLQKESKQTCFYIQTTGRPSIMSQSEIIIFIQSWIIVYACLAYAYVVGKIVPKGSLRSLLILPLVALFLLLPIRLTSLIPSALTGLFVSWLASFKLVLFAFGKGPLTASDDDPHITFPRFLALGSLPIIQAKKSTANYVMVWDFAGKIVLFGFIYKMYSFKAQLHPFFIFHMYGSHLYLTLEFITFGVRAVAGHMLGLELDVPFNQPMFSTSVQNFWGRRWNLPMGSILRVTIYDPVRSQITPYIGSEHAKRLSVLATFATSAIMHEILYYYISKKPSMTWDMTWYFLLQGIMVVIETDVKRVAAEKKWRLPRLVSMIWTTSFMVVISFIVFAPMIDNCSGHLCAAEEFAPFVTFLKTLKGGLMLSSFKGVV